MLIVANARGDGFGRARVDEPHPCRSVDDLAVDRRDTVAEARGFVAASAWGACTFAFSAGNPPAGRRQPSTWNVKS
jgi:hypothetical protein